MSKLAAHSAPANLHHRWSTFGTIAGTFHLGIHRVKAIMAVEDYSAARPTRDLAVGIGRLFSSHMPLQIQTKS